MRQFEPAPRVTEADKAGDIHVMQRKLSEQLYLCVKGERFGSVDAWTFPSFAMETADVDAEAAYVEAERSRLEQLAATTKGRRLEQAEEALSVLGPSLRRHVEQKTIAWTGEALGLHVMGHAPLFYIPVPSSQPGAMSAVGTFGTKTFIFPMYAMRLQANLDPDAADDVAWLTKDEMLSGTYPIDKALIHVFQHIE